MMVKKILQGLGGFALGLAAAWLFLFLFFPKIDTDRGLQVMGVVGILGLLLGFVWKR